MYSYGSKREREREREVGGGGGGGKRERELKGWLSSFRSSDVNNV